MSWNVNLKNKPAEFVKTLISSIIRSPNFNYNVGEVAVPKTENFTPKTRPKGAPITGHSKRNSTGH
jgi:hypothetical protein